MVFHLIQKYTWEGAGKELVKQQIIQFFDNFFSKVEKPVEKALGANKVLTG